MRPSFFSAAGLLLLLLALVPRTSAVPFKEGTKDEDLIHELPNQPKDGIDFRQYSGYVVVNQTSVKRYFYYFVEAAGGKPTSKPLIFSLVSHGGDPKGLHAKSSTLLAAFQQFGPFLIDSDGETLLKNPYPWNNFANIVFVESPVTIGFTASNNSEDYEGADDVTIVEDLYQFMSRWLDRFPEYQQTDVHIFGQDYIGVVGPLVAQNILQRNGKPGYRTINLKGLLMGNPSMDTVLERQGQTEFYYRSNIVDETTYRVYNRDCVAATTDRDHERDCMGLAMKAGSMYWMIDLFNLYSKTCPELTVDKARSFHDLAYSCHDRRVAAYMNTPSVQSALHSQPPGNETTFNWGLYEALLWGRSSVSTLQKLKEIMSQGIRVFIFSGVLDFQNNVITDGFYFNQMNVTTQSDWRPWFDSSVQVAGFTESYKEGLTFATVRNAGRKVGADQPLRGYLIAQAYLENGGQLPTSPLFPAVTQPSSPVTN